MDPKLNSGPGINEVLNGELPDYNQKQTNNVTHPKGIVSRISMGD